VWVDDEFFHIDHHVRHIALPHPGTDEQLKELAGRLMSQQLDRSKPLWELNIVEGLESGGFAIITKIHHCMIDGMSGIDLMAVILDFTDKVEHVEPAPWVARPAPNGTELAVREIARSVSSLLAGLTHLSDLRGGMSDRVDSLKHRVEASLASLGSGWLTPTGKTPLNGPIGPGRSFEWLELPLDGVKKIKNTHGATVNDAMLAIVAGGIRHYLLTEAGMTSTELAEIDFRIMAPVSVRTKSEQGTMGNKVAMWLITLPLAEPDPAKRIAKIKRATKELKETDQALGASTLVSVSMGAPATLVSLAARLASRARPFNMTVTNVPGPQFPLYMAGSQMQATYPLVPLWQSHGLGIAMFSLNGVIDIGLNCDRNLVEDPTLVAKALLAAFEELAETPAPLGQEDAPAKKRPPMGTR
jgi:WS/DGAT/MGAT family acyltransferase